MGSLSLPGAAEYITGDPYLRVHLPGTETTPRPEGAVMLTKPLVDRPQALVNF
jgi:hypothetical protein